MADTRPTYEQALALRAHYARSAEFNSQLCVHALVDGRLRTAAQSEYAYRRAASRCRRLGELVRDGVPMTTGRD
jgi:hypothetical protein